MVEAWVEDLLENFRHRVTELERRLDLLEHPPAPTEEPSAPPPAGAT
jgi:hypothetical protein